MQAAKQQSTRADAPSPPSAAVPPRGAWWRALLDALVRMLTVAATVLLLTCGYYYVRLALVEHAAGRAGTARSAAESAAEYARFVSGARRSDAKASVGAQDHYTPLGYGMLVPGVPVVNDTVMNPQLETYVGAPDAGKDARVRLARAVTPALRRYVLRGTRAGQRYMLRLSFLGSPSVGYSLVLYHVRSSALEAAGVQPPAAAEAGDAQMWAEDARPSVVPMDTEVKTITLHARFAQLFADDEEVVYDHSDAMRQAAAEDGSAAREDPYVAVVEVVPHTLSFAADPRDFPVLSYNLQLSPLTGNWLPDVAVPIIVCLVIMAGGVGRNILYPWLQQAVVNSVEGTG